MRPSGPEPPSVYWVRRLAILVVIITVAVGIWWLVGALTGSGAPTSSEATPAPTESSEGDPSAAATAAPAVPTEPVACPDSVILVQATTDASTYSVGEKPRLTLTITNIGEVPCIRDVGPKANELEITSGGYHVWSSDDCNASGKSKEAVLEPGQKVASSITWAGRLSQKGCPDGEGARAKAGRYDVEGRNGKVRSEQTPFALRTRS
jgi:hypothetical protein